VVPSYYCKDAATERCSERALVHADVLDEYAADWFAVALKGTPRMVDVVASERELEEAQRDRDKAEAELTVYVEVTKVTDVGPPVFQRGMAKRQKDLDEAKAKVQVASARTTRLPVGGSLIELWETFTPAERRDVLGGFIARIDVRRGASADLAGHLHIIWSDGTVAHKETRVRKAAA
jgi:hypothetical protein